MGAPDGPNCCVPTRLTVVFSAFFIVWNVHSCLPLFASSATTAPWLVQHSYSGAAPRLSSPEEIGTNTLFWYSTGMAVTLVTLVTCILLLQITLLVTASIISTCMALSANSSTWRPWKR